MSGATVFRPLALETNYAFLDDCPEAVLPALLALPYGTLEERVAGYRSWHAALLAGHLPDKASWPPAPIAEPVRKWLSAQNMVRFCKEQTALVDALMTDILDSFRRASHDFERDVVAQLRALEELERKRLRDQQDAERARQKSAKRFRDTKGLQGLRVDPDEATMARLREQARRAAAARGRDADAELMERWGEQARIWAEISDVFGDLGDLMGLGWDMSMGLLKQTGWRDLTRLRALVAKLPQVSEVVRSLGRLHEAQGEPSVAETVMVPVQRLEEERREVRVPYIPAETRGVDRSDDIARMLPTEAALLGHPALRMLWHARRAERSLMTYRVEGVEVDVREVLREGTEAREQRAPRPERGPIIAVVDTSGSMHGLPERVAKALVLEALRTAHAEKRRCMVYLYSGPGQVQELELSLSPEGIQSLLEFIGLSFGGGNDEASVLARVLQRLKQNDWRKADVVFVSDGEWPAPQGVVQDVAKARETGTRFHGVQIGNRGRTGLHAVCDPVHVFHDWAALEGWGR
ncbi:MAG: VWA domain-containing protein [Myxococcales bacterium]|nr:VWA domain-containing protein [Myxococcales bacterium]